jgi:predicted nucleotidyltransferase
MSTDLPLPGNPQHQKLLGVIAALYASDDRVLAVLLFGSLARDDWDAYSDLDLEVVVRDNVQIDTAGELDRLGNAFAAHGEHLLFTTAVGDAGYMVLQSLGAVAVDYHPLPSISPYVLAGWRMLCGSLDAQAIRKAAEANDRPAPSLNQQVHRALWVALAVDIALQRRQFWRALPSLERMRTALLIIFAASRGSKRAHQIFEEEASAALRAKFARTLPQCFPDSTAASVRSLAEALGVLLHLLEHDLAELSNDQLELGPGEREVIRRLQMRQAALRNDAA